MPGKKDINTMVLRLVVMLVLAAFWPAAGQTIDAQVRVEAKRLQPEDQELLNELPRQLISYINNNDWTGENKNIVIKCRIGFIIESVRTRGSEKLFRGQFQITSPSGENFVDKSFEFFYQRGQLFERQRSLFDPLLSLIDYYIFMIVAGELDAYILRGGTPVYSKARSVCDEAIISTYSSGWRGRLDEVNLITDGDHQYLREAKFYYYEGLFYLEVRQDYQRVPQYARKTVELLKKTQSKKPNSPALKRFLDAHHQEFCTLFTYDEDRSNINDMIIVDNRHTETYEGCESAP